MRTVTPKDAERVCPECGKGFTAHHGRQRFCEPEHKRVFEKRLEVRGRVLVPLAVAWRQGKRGKTGASTYALNQMCALLDMWAADDAAAGRKPELIAERKQAQDWKACDLGLPVL